MMSAKLRRPRVRCAGRLVLTVMLMLSSSACSAPDDSDDQAVTASSAPAAAAPDEAAADADAVASFVAFAARMPAEGAIDADVLAEALRRLAGVASAEGAVPLDLAVDLRVSAEHVQLNPESPDVAKTVRQTLGDVTAALAGRLAGADVARLEAATEAIDAGAPLTGQAAALREYFRLTAAAFSGARG